MDNIRVITSRLWGCRMMPEESFRFEVQTALEMAYEEGVLVGLNSTTKIIETNPLNKPEEKQANA